MRKKNFQYAEQYFAFEPCKVLLQKSWTETEVFFDKEKGSQMSSQKPKAESGPQ